MMEITMPDESSFIDLVIQPQKLDLNTNFITPEITIDKVFLVQKTHFLHYSHDLNLQ